MEKRNKQWLLCDFLILDKCLLTLSFRIWLSWLPFIPNIITPTEIQQAKLSNFSFEHCHYSLYQFQNSELLTLTYGAFVTQIIRDFENIDDVNKQLERIGYNMGVRFIEDFLSRTASTRCIDMRETADKIQQAFRMYLNVQPTISNWAASADEFSLIFDTNPLAEFVELPPDMSALRYSGILCGCIRGALEMVQLEVQCWFVQVNILLLKSFSLLLFSISIFAWHMEGKKKYICLCRFFTTHRINWKVMEQRKFEWNSFDA